MHPFLFSKRYTYDICCPFDLTDTCHFSIMEMIMVKQITSSLLNSGLVVLSEEIFKVDFAPFSSLKYQIRIN